MSADMHQQLDFIDLHLFEAVHGRRLADDEGTLFSTPKVDVVKSKKKTTPVSNSIQYIKQTNSSVPHDVDGDACI